MLGNIILFIKRIALIASGVSAETAWYFASWRGGGNITLLKHFKKSGDNLIHIPSKAVLPITLLHCFNRDVNLLERVCKHYSPVATDGGLKLHASPNDIDIAVVVGSYQALFVFDEIYGREIYGLWVPEDCIVVDVGMNIGMASVYFATFPFVKHVYGFELIRSTYELALQNFSLNPELKNKISAKAIGIGLSSSYYMNNRNAAGATDTSIGSLTPYSGNDVGSESIVEVHGAVELLSNILAQNGHSKMILKLDCEGLEYEILPILADSGVLKQINIIMVEWHNHGALPLLKVLSEVGFACQYRPDEYFDGQLGVIYAFNRLFQE